MLACQKKKKDGKCVVNDSIRPTTVSKKMEGMVEGSTEGGDRGREGKNKKEDWQHYVV